MCVSNLNKTLIRVQVDLGRKHLIGVFILYKNDNTHIFEMHSLPPVFK